MSPQWISGVSVIGDYTAIIQNVYSLIDPA